MNNKKKVLIRNPDSGRLISIKGKKGKEVLKKLKDENLEIREEEQDVKDVN